MSADKVHADSESSQRSTLACMRAAKRWIVWAPDKQPFYIDCTPRRGTLDTPEDSSRLATFDDACRAAKESGGRFAGIGFALGPDEYGGHWQGIDLDAIPDGQLDQWAALLPGYVEVSPSGKGLHAIGYGRPFASLGSNGSGFEAYASGRYFTFTNETRKNEPLVCLADVVETKVAPLHSRPAGAITAEPVWVDPKTASELRSALSSLRSDDRELWVRMGHALHELGNIGRGMWIDWSQTSDKWKPGDAKKWDTFKGDRTGYKAVFAEAARQGWLNPMRKDALIRIPQSLATPFRILTDQDLQAAPPLRWLVKHVIPEEGFGTIFGDSGTYKSFIALDLLAAISRGAADWFGHRVKPAPCVYVPFEGKGGVPRRVAAWRLAAARQAYPDALMVAAPTDDVTTRMAFITDPMNLRTQGDRERLVETLKVNGWAGGVLCIDTLAQAGGGMDENSSEGMGEMIAIFQELQQRLRGVVLVIHHTGKDPTRGMRGWSGLRGALDFAIECQSTEKYQGRFLLDKVKDEEGGKQFLFTMQRMFLGYDDDGDEVSSLVVVPPAPDLAVAPTAPSNDVQHDADDETFIWDWVKREVHAGNYPSVSSLCGQLAEMKEHRAITQKRVRDAVHRLKARSALKTDTDKSPSGNFWLRAVDVQDGSK